MTMSAFELIYSGVRNASLIAILALALVLFGSTGAAIAGLLPWLEIDAGLNGRPVPNAGMYLQIGFTFLAVALCFFLPTDRRVMALEHAHRDFRISMDDVTASYRAAHAADREGAFRLSSEFDAVRERLDFMRRHPDLKTLEPGVLEVAAQMSETSRDLAETYSSDKVDRSRTFLQQRQEEVDAFDAQLTAIRRTIDEIKRWDQQLNAEEGARKGQLKQLQQDLEDLVPGLGYRISLQRMPKETQPTLEPNVFSLPDQVGKSKST